LNVSLVIPRQSELADPTAYPHLGLGYIAAVLEQRGHNVTVTDLNYDTPIPHADTYGVTCLSSTYDEVKDICKYLMRTRKGRVVVGGIHPTMHPRQVLDDCEVDYVVTGEAEYTFPKLVEEGSHTSLIHSGVVEDLDSLPFPARHLLPNVVDVSGIHGQEKGERATTIMGMRGCPYRCSYCCQAPQLKTVRFRSPLMILHEMKEVGDVFGVTHFRFVDDIFTLRKDRVKRLSRMLRGLDLSWVCITRADALSHDLLVEMKNGGCREIHVGVESGSQRILDAMNKQTTVHVLERGVRMIKQAGIKAKTYLMYGYTGETDEDREKTIEFVKRTRPDKVTVSYYQKDFGYFYPDEDEDYNEFRSRINGLL
jgi:radical SAM superfamily enzyme YgiQ (UPF0313 family)